MHVYEQAIPLQLSADALIGLQTMPQPLQLLVVSVGVAHPPKFGAALAQSAKPGSHVY
jgi:hypothetical protein